MCDGEWLNGPFGLDSKRGQTFPTKRTVLVVVHSATPGIRLSDVWPLLGDDRRVQLVFTRPPGALMAAGTDRFLEQLGGVVLPWRQAVSTRFDLAVAASYGRLEQLHAPVLLLSHGIGFSKRTVRYDGLGPEAPLEVAGMERAGIVFHGHVIPSGIVVPTTHDRETLVRAVPESSAVAFVGGDLCYDRLAVSLRRRASYRRALGVGGRKLVAVSSTWGAGSLLETRPDALADIARQLPRDEYCLAAIVHPNAWSWHGPLQVRAWCAEAVRRGMILIDPEEGWRAVLAAADCLIGDHGSVTAYAAAIGVPVLFGVFPSAHIVPGSPVARLGEVAPRLGPGPLPGQVADMMSTWQGEEIAPEIRRGVTDIAGQSAGVIRRAMYRLMGLPEPLWAPRTVPVPPPRIASLGPGEAGTGVAS